MRPDRSERFVPPREHSAHLEHHRNFYNAVRTRKPFFEDGVFGLRTAGPSLLTDIRLWEGPVCKGGADKVVVG